MSRLLLGDPLLRAIAILLLTSTIATAQPAPSSQGDSSGWDALKDVVQPQPSTVTADRCDITALLDYDKYLLRMDDFRKEWFYLDKSTEFYQRRGHRLLLVIGRKFATVLTQGIYASPESVKPKVCRFRLMVSDQDMYGNDKPYVAVSWRFTRDLAAKTRWDRLDDMNFPRLALDFQYGPALMEKVDLDPPM